VAGRGGREAKGAEGEIAVLRGGSPGYSTMRLIRCFEVDLANTLKRLQREGLIHEDWWTPPRHDPVKLCRQRHHRTNRLGRGTSGTNEGETVEGQKSSILSLITPPYPAGKLKSFDPTVGGSA
jgi:hypothetical protein